MTAGEHRGMFDEAVVIYADFSPSDKRSLFNEVACQFRKDFGRNTLLDELIWVRNARSMECLRRLYTEKST